MRIYKIKKSYDADDTIFYQVIPYNLEGTFKCMKFNHFLKFIFSNCRLTKNSANKLCNKLNKKEHKNN